jgi:hypothetical protein
MQNKVMLLKDPERLALLKGRLKEGVDYEMVIREKPRWDTDAMRKYFHGPVLKFVNEQFKGVGCIYSKDELKSFLKASFGPYQDVPTGKVKIHIPKSTSEYDFKTYTQFLKDIDSWCMDCFGAGLPLAEEVE